jgi:DNA-directed RNA polymerase specialized sigma24 family protein
LDEFNLIQEVQSGNLDSFTPLYEMYFDKIYSFLLMKANGNVQLAEDATASTFIKAFESIDKFSLDEPNSSF